MADVGKTCVSGFLEKAANGNEQASEWLNLWHHYNHAVDDIIDEPDWSHKRLLAVMILCCGVCSHPWYRANVDALQAPVLLATSLYAGSVKWEQTGQPEWKQRWSQVTRHAGNLVIGAVALICGSWEHWRSLDEPLLASCYIHRADKYGGIAK